ncbi:bifunctional methylenetetrahydrofolate dehydrogenase/methenyltetrahydrofolate cyclohydrolase FolD [Thioclava sp. BHET1]|nr:bifunctional methylenetetrahydrofolate dehydrogenase/methenyltetrahydrofolate cyclohydrolase FolD [Thioclava sp. BHET1]
MTARVIDGRAQAARLRSAVAQDTAALRARSGVTPCLAVILVGADPASELYVANKIRHTTEVGMISQAYRLHATASEAELMALIADLNADAEVHGILVQLPLPKHIATARVTEAIDPAKDVDGFTAVNVGRLASGQTGIVPCTPLGCLMMLKAEIGDLRGKVVAVVGCSNVVGRPLTQLLLREDCTVLVAHRHTVDLPGLVAAADVVVAAAGVPGLIRGDWLKAGAVVLDVGISRVTDAQGNSRIAGDVAFDEALFVAGAISPVPGGVGPMTIACLLSKTLATCHGLIASRQPCPSS